MPRSGWRAAAATEIRCIKRKWATRFGWCPRVKRGRGWIELLVRFTRGTAATTHVYVLRLRYEPDYRTAGRREAFVAPDDHAVTGPEQWPKEMRGMAEQGGQKYICLEGTYGFHSVLHRDRPGERASLNRLLMEIEKCLTR